MIDPTTRWTCNGCGQNNPEGMINCPKCGAWRNPRPK